MLYADNADINIISTGRKNITISGAHTFKSLNVESDGGIIVENDISTYAGSIFMSFAATDLILSSGVDFTSSANISLSGDHAQILGETVLDASESVILSTSISMATLNSLTVTLQFSERFLRFYARLFVFC